MFNANLTKERKEPDEKAEQKALILRCAAEKVLVISIENSLQFPITAVLDIIRPFVNYRQLKTIEISLNKLMAILTNKRYSQGMLKGCPDLFFPLFKLFIEMKRRNGGVVSAEQLAVHARLRQCGYTVEVCHGALSAWQVVSELRRQHG